MNVFAAIMSAVAALTGILAVGSGRHWQFTVADYFRGKRNAILYLWVTGSTIFSMCHAGALVTYGLPTNHAEFWGVLHSTIGALLIAAHLFVRSTLSKEIGPVDKYLWGAQRRAV